MLRHRQRVNLVIGAVFLFDLFVVIEVVERTVTETVSVLIRFSSPQDRRKCVAEVHGSDFASLCCYYFGLMPCAVVANTAAYREVLPVKVYVLPGERADLADTKSRVTGDLNREQGGIVLCL